MSVWTHVAAVFRVDDFRFEGKQRPDFEKIFGKSCLWGSPSKVWADYHKHPEQYLPCGSEGSLEMSVWENPNKEDITAYSISVFGDLRDYSNIKKIEKWFDECCKKLWIRQAVITIECETGKTIVKRYEKNE
jgi:hypothetical protein